MPWPIRATSTRPLVDAYLARRALDYLVGFNLSPVLWRKLPGARSAGRVQSVALRLVCDREAEIERFVSEEYWQIAAELKTPRSDVFTARLVSNEGKRLQKMSIANGEQAQRDQGDARGGDLPHRQRRGKADEAQSGTALHHVDAAAGRLVEARFQRVAHHAGRAAPLRRHRPRRRDGRPHHLHANGRRPDGARKRSTPRAPR